mmetsp:Transcript_95539/g.270084  ORF Transcript_95539/g.270084 Transcript_95539/m.270084 type:complete len:329 (+) Transcript_95539:739-1725(+)
MLPRLPAVTRPTRAGAHYHAALRAGRDGAGQGPLAPGQFQGCGGRRGGGRRGPEGHPQAHSGGQGQAGCPGDGASRGAHRPALVQHAAVLRAAAAALGHHGPAPALHVPAGAHRGRGPAGAAPAGARLHRAQGRPARALRVHGLAGGLHGRAAPEGCGGPQGARMARALVAAGAAAGPAPGRLRLAGRGLHDHDLVPAARDPAAREGRRIHEPLRLGRLLRGHDHGDARGGLPHVRGPAAEQHLPGDDGHGEDRRRGAPVAGGPQGDREEDSVHDVAEGGQGAAPPRRLHSGPPPGPGPGGGSEQAIQDERQRHQELCQGERGGSPGC